MNRPLLSYNNYENLDVEKNFNYFHFFLLSSNRWAAYRLLYEQWKNDHHLVPLTQKRLQKLLECKEIPVFENGAMFFHLVF